MEQWRRGRGRLGDVLLVGGVGVTGISGTYDSPSSPIIVYEIIQQIVHGGKEGCLWRWLDVHGAGRQRSPIIVVTLGGGSREALSCWEEA